MRSSFDLREQPWIPVRRLDGATEEVSLREIFARAHEFSILGGELPTTAVALLRLMLAILYRALPWTNQPVADWSELWRQDRLPRSEIENYFDEFADRFDLLHPDTPFLQVADLRTAKGAVSDLLRLIADVPNGEQFFTTRAGKGLAAIGFAEAARWVVHCQAYDPSGIKSGALGDSRVKKGRGYPIGVAWAGAIGVVVVEGRNLRETLLLNLCLHDVAGEPWTPGEPVWERAPLSAAEEVLGGRRAVGPTDLLTWPSRRIRLVHDGQRVTGVLICNGDRLAPQDQFIEPMTAWRRSQPQERKLKREPVYMPLTHRPDRSLWRGLTALLPLNPSRPGDGASRLQPLVLQWLRRVQDVAGDAFPSDMALQTRAVGLVYGSNNSVVADLVDDALTVHAVLLGEQGRDLRRAALEAVESADAAATAIGHLAANLTEAAGGDGGAVRDETREQYYFALDAAFRTWLAGLRGETEPSAALRDWHVTAFERAREEERRLLQEAPPAAWLGREISDRAGTRRVDAARASLWFRSALRRALPLAADLAQSEDELAASADPEEAA